MFTMCFESIRSTHKDVPAEGGAEETCKVSSAVSAPEKIAIRDKVRNIRELDPGAPTSLLRHAARGHANAPLPVSLSVDCQSAELISLRAVPLMGLAARKRALGVPTPFDPILERLGDTETGVRATGMSLREVKAGAATWLRYTASGRRETVEPMPETWAAGLGGDPDEPARRNLAPVVPGGASRPDRRIA